MANLPNTSPMFTTEGPDFYQQAYSNNAPFAVGGSYTTTLSSEDEQKFRQWVRSNNVPFDPDAKLSDYDMRGFWQATQKGNTQPWAGGKTHFPDTYKTPYDTTFSAESKYATKDNPFMWVGDRLIDTRDGRVIFAPEPEKK